MGDKMNEMKKDKLYFSLFISMFVLNLLLPVGSLITIIFGYSFELFNYSVMAIITFSLSLFFMVFTIRKNDFVEKYYKKRWFVLLSVLTFINFLSYCLKFNHESFYMTIIFNLIMILNFVFTVVLNLLLSDTKAKLVVNIIAVLVLVLPLVFSSIFVVLFSGMGYVKVVRSVPSPNGEYVAEILDANQGALGGDTIIQIQENKGINCLIFKIEKKPNRIYLGEWGEFDDIDVRWENNEVVLIDSVKYPIE